MSRVRPPAQPPLLLRLLLLPLAPLYALWARLRPALYARGWLATHHAAAPVIAVGNLTLGGSGKSPLVDYLLREAARAGLRAVVLSRGYRRRGRSHVLRVRLDEGGPADPQRMGDEPYLLARRNPGHAIFVGRDRVAAARLAEVLERPDLLLLDDGYQHLRLARDLNVLLVDAGQGLSNGWLLPWGTLREPATALARADVILISKAGLGDAVALKADLAGRPGVRAPVFTCDYRPVRLTRLDGGAELPLEAVRGAEVSLLCAIAQPGSFARAVERLGARVRALHALRDHDPFGPATLERVAALTVGAAPERPAWLTTEKDAVKLQGRLAPAERLWVLEMEVVPEPAAAGFFFDFLSALQLH